MKKVLFDILETIGVGEGGNESLDKKTVSVYIYNNMNNNYCIIQNW